MIRELLDQLSTLHGRLRRGNAIHVNDRQTKNEVIALGTSYFTNVRGSLVLSLGESEALLNHDGKWQDLIQLAHSNNARKTYIRLISSIQKELVQLNVACLSHVAEKPANKSGLSDLTPAELKIICTLESSVPSAAASYRQAILDLRSERLSYRGTASELREALRETLDHLAPDIQVMSQSGFTPEPGQKKPTMKQKAQYILGVRGRSKTQQGTIGKSIELIDGLSGEVARAVYNQASLATHVETSRTEVWKVKRYVDTVFFDLLEITEPY